MNKEIEKFWDEASGWYQKSAALHTTAAHYGPFCADEDQLQLLGDVNGKKILELGCGGAQCSIAFAKQGAICTGIDLSEKQLKYARKLAQENNVQIELIKGDIQTLEGIKSGFYDIVFSAYALQYVPDLSKCFKEVYRVLKKNGLFVFSFDNPYYLTINPDNFKIEKSYHKTGKYEERQHWDDDSQHDFIMYIWKISDIYAVLQGAKFSVDRIIEPDFYKDQTIWRGNKWKELYPEKLAEMIPPAIIFKARK